MKRSSTRSSPACARTTSRIWDPLAFQAPDFYRKLGFEVAGTIDGIAGSPARFFLLKRYPELAGG